MFGTFCLEKQWNNYRCSIAPRHFPLQWHGKPIVSFYFFNCKWQPTKTFNFWMYLFSSWVVWLLLSKPCMRCHVLLKFNCNGWAAILVSPNFSCYVVTHQKAVTGEKSWAWITDFLGIGDHFININLVKFSLDCVFK